MTGPPSIACWCRVSDLLTRVGSRAFWATLLVASAACCAAAASAERVVIPFEGEATPYPTILAGFWELHLWPIIGTVGFCLLQVTLIIGLLVNRAKRRQGEAEATLIADISSKFVNLAADEVDREIMEAERRICELLGLDLAAIWQWSDPPPGGFTLTHFYSAKEGPQPSTRLNQEDFPWFRDQMLAGRIVALASLKEMPAEAAHDRDVCRQLGVKSNLCIPLAVGGGPPVGILGLNTTQAERGWPDALVKRLQLVAQIFANALARKRTEVALREHADKFQTIVSTTADGFWVVDRDGRILEANDECCRLYGYSRSELLALSIKDFEATRDATETQRHIALISAAGFSRFETRHRCKDGRIVDIEVSTTYRANAGTFIAFLRNITESKRTDQALRAGEARLAAGVELAGLGYYEVDLGEHLIFVDERFQEICGSPAGHHQDLQPLKFWMEHLHPDDRKRMLDERDKLHDGRLDKVSIEYRYLHPGHGQKWLHHLAGVATRNAAGHAIRTFGVVRDITQRRRAEQETMELRGLLAHADRVTLLGQLASSLAHELSQPLGAILRNAEAAEIMLQTAAPDVEELRAIVKDILSDDTRAGLVIERLRSLLKRRSLDPQPVALQSVIDEVLPLVHADAAARHVTLAYSAAADLPSILGDRIHLQQVLLNLLVNAMDALDACPPNQRSIQVSACRPYPNIIEIRVSDNGPGIPAESLKRLFEPFYTTKANGMGMGLPVSKTIIEAHKGKLWAEHGPQGGACFCFTVPVAGNQLSVISYWKEPAIGMVAGTGH